ncbi:MAG: SPOR domain-containing protein [Azospirillaceae bacterium]|nr:SPOR domain-containing protein [Azospirillaceae bacterium]
MSRQDDDATVRRRELRPDPGLRADPADWYRSEPPRRAAGDPSPEQSPYYGGVSASPPVDPVIPGYRHADPYSPPDPGRVDPLGVPDSTGWPGPTTPEFGDYRPQGAAAGGYGPAAADPYGVPPGPDPGNEPGYGPAQAPGPTPAGPWSRGWVYAGVGAAALLVLAGGWMLLGGHHGGPVTTGGAVPLIQADRTPYKLRPDQPGGMEVPNQDILVYERLHPDGKNESPPGVEQLLPPPEEPLQRPAPPPSPPANLLVDPNAPPVAPTADGAVAAVTPATPEASAPATGTTQGGAGPGVTPPPASAPPPVVATTAPKPPKPATPRPAPPSAAKAPVAPRSLSPAALEAAQILGQLPASAVSSASGAPASLTPPGRAAAAGAPVPLTAARNPSRPLEVATASPRPIGSQARAASGGGYRIQVASVPTAAEATSEWERIASRFSSALGGVGHQVIRADLGEKGVHYRVLGGPMDEARAAGICQTMRAQNIGCILVRP